MNIVRGITANGDWSWGQGQQSYLSGQARVLQNINTRLKESIGDCFFNLGAGLDPNLYSQKNILLFDLAIRGIIVNTDGVVGIAHVSSTIDANRIVTFTYKAVTIYGSVTDQYSYNIQAGSP